MMIHELYQQIAAAFLASWLLYPLMRGWHGHGHHHPSHFHTKQEENALHSGIFKRIVDVIRTGYEYGQSPSFPQSRKNENLPGDFLHIFSKLQGPFQSNLECQGNSYHPTLFGNKCDSALSRVDKLKLLYLKALQDYDTRFQEYNRRLG